MDIEAIKDANLIEDVIQQTFPLRGRGRYLRAEAHDSLVVDVYNQCYFWNSRDEQGDVITWVQKRQRTDFKGAVTWLCQRGGLPEPRWGNENIQAVATRRVRYEALTVAARQFVRNLRGDQGQAARDYCHSRGWTDETIQRAGLGFADGDRELLQDAFSMYEIDAASPAAQAALGIRAGMLIYPHVEHGRVVYLAARSIVEKAHYNPPVELIGERQLYFNWEYQSQGDQVIVVEGQADAITLAQWGIPAIALAGVAVNQGMLKMLARHKQIYVALDPDETGVIAARKIADALGPLVRMVNWPERDANAWLQAGAGADECRDLLATASMWVDILAREAGQADNGQRPEALRRAFRAVARLDDFDLATYRKCLAEEMELGLREFDGMLKATQPEIEDPAAEEPMITLTIVGGQIQMKTSEDYYLLEALYRPPEGSAGASAISGGKTLFAVRDPAGAISTVNHLDVDDVRYVPPPPESQMLTKRVVSFAEVIGPLLKTGDLVEEIRKTIHKYVDIDPFFERLSAYYVLFTWMYDCFNTIPYLRFRGDYGTGKSRARKVIGALSFRPMRASGAATVSPIFRMIDAWRGTLLVEEADYGQSDYAQEIIKIYNQGYDREQGVVLRSGDKNSGFETEAYVCFGPKILAMRGEFKDEALISRFLTKEMGGPTTRADIPIEMPREFELIEAPRLRGLLLRYRLEHWRPYIELNYDALDMSIEPRLNQIVLALYSLVDDPELLAELQEFVREYNKRLIEERGLTLAAKVLEALIVQFHLNQTTPVEDRDLSTLRITERVNQLIDFENYGYGEYIAKHLATDNKVTDRKVGSVLRKQLQFQSERSGKFNGRHVVIWEEERAQALRKRYGLDDDRLVNLLEIVNKLDAMEQEHNERVQGPLGI